ncbi:MAG: ComF family protein [Mycobacterium sp.]
MLDLVLPLQCGGCRAQGTAWCTRCDRELRLKADHPQLVSPRVDPGVPVFALGRYAGVRRRAIIAVKEQGRADLITPLAVGLIAGITRLLDWGLLDPTLTLVPAPTRWSAARRRGGDPVARMATVAAAALPDGVTIATVLRMRAFVRDSVGLAGAQRQRNVSGRVRQSRSVRGPVVLVDDVVTTGATATESVRTLRTHGSQVAAVLAVAHA